MTFTNAGGVGGGGGVIDAKKCDQLLQEET